MAQLLLPEFTASGRVSFDVQMEFTMFDWYPSSETTMSDLVSEVKRECAIAAKDIYDLDLPF